MKHIYIIAGMTCNTCVASVADAILKVEDIAEVDVNLKNSEVKISMGTQIPTSIFETALPDTYLISKKENGDSEIQANHKKDTSKLQQLKPLLLIFPYLFTAAFLLNCSYWDTGEAMLDFMGLFYMVLSFFKLLDLKGFPESFNMYDPLAKIIPIYGWIYPFIGLALGLFFLMRFQVEVALVVLIFVSGITAVGVTKVLFDKKNSLRLFGYSTKTSHDRGNFYRKCHNVNDGFHHVVQWVWRIDLQV